ncbi:sexual development protein [Xylariaceae sp. FL1272]|nr:sexual development protein [Xylariaceae sp. FL1272]
MLTQLLVVAAGLLGSAVAYPAEPDSSINGFPTPNAQQLLAIEHQALGKLSNASPPPTLSQTGVTNFQLILFNENTEVAFFSELISNITNDVPGFDYVSEHRSKAEIVEILKTVLAQEELHALTAKDILDSFGAFAPPPCTYKFPVSSLEDGITLAETLTAVVLGTLQDAEQGFAQNGDDGPVRAVSSVIGQEGEQNGFYRFFLDRKPSEKPFLTTNVGAFAYSALQEFVVECPFDLKQIPIPIFTPLNILSKASPTDSYLSFSADLSSLPDYTEGSDYSKLFVTYFSGSLNPISEPIVNAVINDGALTFDALFPFTENQMFGLSIASLTNSSGFTNPDDVVASTLAAPGLIEVDVPLSSSTHYDRDVSDVV